METINNVSVDVADGDTTFENKYLLFRSDPDKMDQMNAFVSDLLENAEKQAGIQLEAKKVFDPIFDTKIGLLH